MELITYFTSQQEEHIKHRSDDILQTASQICLKRFRVSIFFIVVLIFRIVVLKHFVQQISSQIQVQKNGSANI